MLGEPGLIPREDAEKIVALIDAEIRKYME